MKTIIEVIDGQLYIYEETEKHFHRYDRSKRKNSVTSKDLAENCEICDDNFFLVINGPVYTPKEKVKRKRKPKTLMSNMLKEGQVCEITGPGEYFESKDYIGLKFIKRGTRLNGYDNGYIGVADNYPCKLVSRK